MSNNQTVEQEAAEMKANPDKWRRSMAAKYHPDKFMDPEAKEIAEEIMKDFNEMADRAKGKK